MIGVLTRRSLLAASASMLMSEVKRMPVSEAFAHVLLGSSDLEHGMYWFEDRSGVHPAMGGVHPRRGTRNALASLGGQHYLEVIAPDPAQAGVEPRFSINNLTQPRLINFAVRTSDIERTAASLQRAGVLTSGLQDGSRRTASGALLKWKTIDIRSDLSKGGINPIPFFIEWSSESIHPSRSAPSGCTIEELRFEHPRPEDLMAAFRAMGLEATVTRSDDVRIVAALQTPKGLIELN